MQTREEPASADASGPSPFSHLSFQIHSYSKTPGFLVILYLSLYQFILFNMSISHLEVPHRSQIL